MQYMLIGLIVIGGLFDLKSRIIPNKITFPLIIISLLMSIINGNVKSSLLGLGLAFVIGFIGFVLGGLGAGDVKLMMGIGAAFGKETYSSIILIATITGIFYAIVKSLMRIIKEKDIYTWLVSIKNTVLTFNSSYIVSFFKRENKMKIPFGTCLAIGTIITTLY